VRILPAGRDTRVARVVTYDGDLESGVSGQSVTLTLAEEIDVSRGDMLCSPVSPAKVGDRLEAQILWLVREPLVVGKTYLLKIGAKVTAATISTVNARIEIETGLAAPLEPGATLQFNEIGEASLSLETMIACDPFIDNRETGGFILIDRITNETAAVGMVKTVASSPGRLAPTLTDLSYASMEGVAAPAAASAPATTSLSKTLAFAAAGGVATFGVVAAFGQDAGLATQIGALAALHYAFEKFWRAPQTPATPTDETPPFTGEGL
jgi:bifunctional enzyme CysN/CysC/sulfate adenylyltransferase subunit 1